MAMRIRSVEVVFELDLDEQTSLEQIEKLTNAMADSSYDYEFVERCSTGNTKFSANDIDIEGEVEVEE